MLDLTQFLVKEHVGMLKLTDAYDIFDPATGKKVGFAHENISGLAKIARLLVKKQFLPTRIEIKPSEDAAPILVLRRGFTFLRARVEVLDASGTLLGWFRAKLLTLGGGFFVHNAAGEQVAEVKGDWKGWNFQFLGKDGSTWGTVTKKWAGLGKELFTSADNYMIALDPKLGSSPGMASLLLAAGLAIDTVFKEQG